MAPWANFFSAAASASAALAGLVFVAVSVNTQRIIKYPHLPARAAATIGALILILVCSMAALAPQPSRALGGEVIVFALLSWLLELWSMRLSFRVPREIPMPRHAALLYAVIGQVQTLPFIAGGILLITGSPRGYAWVAGGSIAVFVFSALSAWVLLIEVLR